MNEKLESIIKNAHVEFQLPEKGVNPPAPPVPSLGPSAHVPVLPDIPTGASGELETVLKDYSYATTAMEKTAALKRLEVLVSDKLTALVGQTNQEFKMMRDANPGKKQFSVGSCVFKSYTKRAEYVFPQHITKMEEALKEAKEACKEEGTAIKKEASVDPTRDKTYSVSIIP